MVNQWCGEASPGNLNKVSRTTWRRNVSDNMFETRADMKVDINIPRCVMHVKSVEERMAHKYVNRRGRHVHEAIALTPPRLAGRANKQHRQVVNGDRRTCGQTKLYRAGSHTNQAGQPDKVPARHWRRTWPCQERDYPSRNGPGSIYSAMPNPLHPRPVGTHRSQRKRPVLPTRYVSIPRQVKITLHISTNYVVARWKAGGSDLLRWSICARHRLVVHSSPPWNHTPCAHPRKHHHSQTVMLGVSAYFGGVSDNMGLSYSSGG